MTLFSIDRDKCQRDGICAAECPMAIINMKTEDGFPAPSKMADRLCINCGHCVAACPYGAFSLETMKSEDCPPVRQDLALGLEHAEHFLRSRRSTRKFEKKSVPRETLARLIEIAGYAPSAHNGRPVNWLVIEDSDEVARMAGLVADWMKFLIKEYPDMPMAPIMTRIAKAWDTGQDYICHAAPHVIVAHASKAEVMAVWDTAIALTYFDLAATSLGLGCCWAGFFNNAANTYPPLKEALNLPDDHKCQGVMMIGHPNIEYYRLPLRTRPKIDWR
ncbi:MAG: nitroreductase family protein [Thermodesulfobacteriota bacterium]|nr:nitroreductase family protein [Thermodesulfobacteriota bacterium]